MPTMKRFARFSAIAVAGVVVLAGTARAQTEPPSYCIADLGAFGSPGSEAYSAAYGINERGDVVGAAQDGEFGVRAFLYRDGELIDIGSFNPEYRAATARAVNAQGQVAGRSIGWSPYPKFPTWVDRPFVWSPAGGFADAAPDVGIDGEVFGLNDAGQMAITLSLVPESRSVSRAHFWDPESGLQEIRFPVQDAAGIEAPSAAWAINQRGQVAGAFEDAQMTAHAYVWDPETRDVVDLHEPSAAASAVVAINDRGDAAGYFVDNQGIYYATVWTQEGALVLIPATLDPALQTSTPEDINNLGDVVGRDSEVLDRVAPQAWVAFEAVGRQDTGDQAPTTALVDLLDEKAREEWQLWYAGGINDARQIIGFGLHDGLVRGFLMSPRPCVSTKVRSWRPSRHDWVRQ
jgi:probable HAF family extracellular repeat protein